MAKTTTSTKAKSTKANAEPSLHGLTLAALKRATSQVTADAKANNGGEVPKLPARSYPVDLALRISGDVIVAKPTKTKPEAKPTFTDEELAACFFALTSSAISDAISLLKRTKPDALKTWVEAYRTARDAAAKKAKRWKKPKGEDKAGAVSGAPSVRIDGSVGTRKVSLDITRS